MISQKMQEALNTQVNAEMWSAYLYLAMSMDATDKGIKGVAHWFRKQYEEEMEHAFKIVEYLGSQLAKVELKAIEAVPTTWECPLEMYVQALAHEKKITSNINNLCGQAIEEKDYATQNFLQWFVNEQVEEEASVQEIIDTLHFIGDDQAALFMFDNSLKGR